jgi:hypothetical protein
LNTFPQKIASQSVEHVNGQLTIGGSSFS